MAYDYDLFVIDVQSTTAPPIEPDVWLIPICDRTSNENAAALADSLRGPMIWLGNKGRQVRDVPAYLQHDIEVSKPSDSVVAKPRIGPEPKPNSSTPAMRVVRLASMMADMARS